MRQLFIAALLLLAFASAPAASDTDKVSVDNALSSFHEAASKGDWDAYFGLMSEDAIFLGTDASERWDKDTFRNGYAAKSKGWTYIMRERHINFTPDGNSAWFDELLDNEKYGTSRGTGILIRTNAGWKISQYHLTFPIPNDLADGITQQIHTFETRQKMGQN